MLIAPPIRLGGAIFLVSPCDDAVTYMKIRVLKVKHVRIPKPHNRP